MKQTRAAKRKDEVGGNRGEEQEIMGRKTRGEEDMTLERQKGNQWVTMAYKEGQSEEEINKKEVKEMEIQEREMYVR